MLNIGKVQCQILISIIITLSSIYIQYLSKKISLNLKTASFHSYTVLRNTLYNDKWAHPLWLAILLANHMSDVLQ